MPEQRLIADIGGTNARFALVEAGDHEPRHERTLACADFATLADAIDHYLANTPGARPSQGVIAVATPVRGDHIKMTNHVWSFSIEETRRTLGFDQLRFINDFTALALALPHLKGEDVRKVGGGEPVADSPRAVIGPGTGLGVSGLVPLSGGWAPLHSEGGHVSFSPVTDLEIDILQHVRKKYPDHVSVERLLSGPGLVNIYEAIAQIRGATATPLSPADISHQGMAGTSSVAREAVDTFCVIMGTAAANLALTLGARGGVYVCGGIIPRFLERFANSGFRARFENKGRFSDYLSAIPTYVVTAKQPAFIGVAHLL